jgi:hypothetical protein
MSRRVRVPARRYVVFRITLILLRLYGYGTVLPQLCLCLLAVGNLMARRCDGGTQCQDRASLTVSIKLLLHGGAVASSRKKIVITRASGSAYVGVQAVIVSCDPRWIAPGSHIACYTLFYVFHTFIRTFLS